MRLAGRVRKLESRWNLVNIPHGHHFACYAWHRKAAGSGDFEMYPNSSAQRELVEFVRLDGRRRADRCATERIGRELPGPVGPPE